MLLTSGAQLPRTITENRGALRTAQPLSVAAATSRPSPAAIHSRHTLVEGRRIHALVAGEGSPVVLLHGLLGLSSRWRALLPIFAGSARVYAPDTLGVGLSERVPGIDASLTASAQRLLAWLDAEELEQVDLVGTSHGGAVAMRFAADYPDRVRSLVLHAPANPFCLGTRPQIRLFSTRAGARVAQWLPHAPTRMQQIALTRMYGDPQRIQAGSLEEYVGSLRVPGSVAYVLSVLRRWVPDMAALQQALPKLRRLRTLLLWGEFDRAVSLASGYMLRSATHAPLEILPGLGHLAFEEAPAQFAAPVLRFLAAADAQPIDRTA